MSDDAVQLVCELMQSTFGTEFKAYYNGEPDRIPIFNLPAIVVTTTTDDTRTGDTASDDVTETLMIAVLLNKADDWGDGVDLSNLTEKRLRALVGRRVQDGTEAVYAENTVKGALRTFTHDELTILAESLHVDYGVSQRLIPSGEQSYLTAEAQITFDVEYSVFTGRVA